jgi:protoporphyrin/coproporphyrin ferrochelatase
LFSAHGLPLSVIESGDPYEYQINEAAKLIAEKVSRKNTRFVVCYQSKVGLKKWLSPSIGEEITKAGTKSEVVVVVPISFVSDHSETLVELDQDYRVFATKMGVKSYHRAKALGTNKIFVDCLKDMCLELSRFQTNNQGLVSFGGVSGCEKKFCKCIVGKGCFRC